MKEHSKTGNAQRLELAAMILLALFLSLLIVRQWIKPFPVVVMVTLVGGAFGGLAAIVNKRMGKPFQRWVGLMIFCMFISNSYSLFKFGGLLSPVVVFAICLPVCGAIFVNMRFGIFMFVSFLALLATLAFMHGIGYQFGELPFTGLANVWISTSYYIVTAVALLLVFSFDQTRLRGETLHARSQAETDFLTGLLNRAGFESRFEKLRKRDRRSAALLVIDIDNFKACNDTRGHDAGDRCLREIATALSSCAIRDSDLIARIGGDEFLALVSGVELKGALAVADKMRDAVSELHIFTGEEPPRKITITVGITCFSGDQLDDLDRLYREADQALYNGKQLGKDCVKTVEPNVYAVDFG